MNPVPDLSEATAIAATGQNKAATTPRKKLLSGGFSIDHPDPKHGEQLMAHAWGVSGRDGTGPRMPSAILSNAASQNSSNSAVLQPASKRPHAITAQS